MADALVAAKKQHHRPIFDFLHDRRFELKVMMTLSEYAWEAGKEAVEGGADRMRR